MVRAFIAIDETTFSLPVLHINSQIFRMSEQELVNLVEEAKWALGHLSGQRYAKWQELATKYNRKGEPCAD